MIEKLLLAPVLLVQGLHVRRSIVRLPEPEGKRQGCLGQGPALRLMILGDSAAAGVGAEHQLDALSGQLAKHLSQRFTLNWKLVARTGETTSSIHALLDDEAAQPVDVIVISLGVNDVTSGKSSSTFIRQTKMLIDRLEANYSPTQIIFTGLPPMGHFPALPNPLRWYLGRQSQRFDRALQETIAAMGYDYLPLDMAPDPHLIAKDGFHPGPPVYELWAKELADRIKQASMP